MPYKIFSRLVTACMLFVLVVGLTTAQDDQLPGPGAGGPVIRGNTRGSGNLGALMPLRCNGVDCADPNVLIWPTLIAINPETLEFEPNVPGSLATGWERSEDGLTFTVSLRQDATWNDGTPITAEDVYFAWEAMQNADLIGLSGGLLPAAQALVGAEVIDPYTIAFQFDQPNCDAVRRMASVPPVPAHAYGYTRGADFDWVSMVNHPMDSEPTVTAGPFNFMSVEPGTAVYLTANTDFWDPTNDQYVVPAGFAYIDVPDFNVMAERFLSLQPGDLNYIHEPDPSIFNTLKDAEGTVQVYTAPGRVWHYLALNIADPSNPQPGLDENGNPIDQGKHPLFGDLRVRQAIQYAINVDEIIDGPLGGNGTPMVSSTIPTAYTIHPTLERRTFDLDEARRLLDEAGFESTGDPLVEGGDGLRTCTTCENAAPGTEFSFALLNPGGVRNDVSILVQAQLARLGIAVEVSPLDFNTLYDLNLGAQVYDAAIAGWRGELPFNPDQRSFFGAASDVPSTDNSGSNYTSYYNARLEELGQFMANGEGCDRDEIIAAAHEVQEILWEEQAYVWLYALNDMYAANPGIQGFAPFPSQGAWNLDAWNVVSLTQ